MNVPTFPLPTGLIARYEYHTHNNTRVRRHTHRSMVTAFEQLVEDDVALNEVPSTVAIIDVDSGSWTVVQNVMEKRNPF